MTDAEKLAKLDELRREWSQEYKDFMEYLDAVEKRLNLNFEPDHKHPEKTLW